MYLINLEAKIVGVVLVTYIDENEKLVKIECTRFVSRSIYVVVLVSLVNIVETVRDITRSTMKKLELNSN